MITSRYTLCHSAFVFLFLPCFKLTIVTPDFLITGSTITRIDKMPAPIAYKITCRSILILKELLCTNSRNPLAEPSTAQRNAPNGSPTSILTSVSMTD